MAGVEAVGEGLERTRDARAVSGAAAATRRSLGARLDGVASARSVKESWNALGDSNTTLERKLSQNSVSSQSSPTASPRGSPRVSMRERGSGGEDVGRKRSPGVRRLTYGPCVAWFGALALGALAPVRRLAPSREAWLSRTAWFDDLFVSPLGPALPLILMLMRWLATSCIAGYDRDRRGRVPLGTCAHIRNDAHAYVFVALTRLVAYRVFNSFWPSVFMSDHVFLAASVFTAIHGEVLSCAVDFLLLVERREKPLRRTTIMCIALFGLACMFATCVEVFVTAGYFHSGVETLTAAALGWFMLQVPLLASVAAPRAMELAAALAL